MEVDEETIDDWLREVAAADPPPLPPPVPTVAGRYRVGEPLGAGGLGLVHAGWDPELEREVAIKFVRPDHRVRASGSALETRLRREAQALARLDHPNVVKVFDVGVASGQVYIAMERVYGETLAAWLHAPGRTESEILAAFRSAGQGLAAAHAADVVHRDFKPENVLVEKSGRVVVVDFGIAQATDSTGDDTLEPNRGTTGPASGDSRMTATGVLVGTPGYAAPEQRGGDPTTPSADQYSFCVSLAEALTGRRPRKESDLAPLPDAMRRVLARGLAAEPSDRWPSMGDLLRALEPAPTRWRWIVAAAVVVGLASATYALASPAESRDAIAEPSAEAPTSPVVREQALALLARGRESAAAGDDAAREQLTSAFFFARAGNEPRVAFEAALALAGEEHDEAQLDEARKWLEHARVLGRSIESPAAHAHLALVGVLLEGDKEAARRDLESAIELLESDPEADVEELGEAHVRAGRLAHSLSQTELARRYFERARALCENEAPRCLAHAIGAHGMLERELGNGEAAVELLRRAAKLQAEALGAEASMTASTRSILGVALTEIGRFDEARVELDEAIRVFELPQHRGHPDLATAYETSGLLLETQGDLDGAERAYQRALATREATIGRDHPYTAVSLMRIASVAYAREDFEAAIRHGTEVQRILGAQSSSDQILLGPSYGLTADARLRLGDVEAARKDAEQAVAALARSDRLPVDLARARFLLARTSWPDRARHDEAKALAREAEAWLAEHENADPALLAEIRAWRAEHDR